MSLADLVSLTGWSRVSKTSLAAGYVSPPTGTANWGNNVNNASRFYISRDNGSRFWVSGSLTTIALRITSKVSHVANFYVAVWRYNGTTWDRIGEEDIWPKLANTSDLQTITLTTPISVEPGDYFGYGFVSDGTATGYFMYATISASYPSYYVQGETPTETGYAWDTKTSSNATWFVRAYVTQGPHGVTIGDSILAGHSANYSKAEGTTTISTTSDVAEYLKTMLALDSIVNFGIGGQTTTQIAARFAADVVALRPRWCLINGGVNDIAGGVITESTFLANWTTMLDAAEAAGIYAICLPILPWTDGTAAQNRTRDTWNASLRTLIESYSCARYVADPLTLMAQSRVGGDSGNLWDIKTAYDLDGVHFTVAGYAMLARCIVRAIADAAVAKSPATLDWSADVSNKPTIGTSTLTQQDVANAAKLAPTAGDPDAGSVMAKLDHLDSIELGEGARTVVITINDGSNPLESVKVRMTKGAESYVGITDSSGEVTFHLDDGSWTVAATLPLYTYTGTTLVVNGNETATYSMTALGTTASDPGYVTGYLYCYDSEGVVEEGVEIAISQYIHSELGQSHDSSTRTETSDANGLVQFANLIPGATYMIRRGNQKVWNPETDSWYFLQETTQERWKKFTIASTATSPYQLPAVTGE